MIRSIAKKQNAAKPPSTRENGFPRGSRIEFVKQSTEQLVLSLPPNPAANRSFGGVALLSGVVLVMVTTFVLVGFLGGFFGQGLPAGVVTFIGFELTLWWVGELVAIGIWLRLRFTRLLVSVERDRFTVQQSLFNWRTLRSLPLDERSRASLQNLSGKLSPNYILRIHGATRVVRFGNTLTNDEKSALVHLINGFLYAGNPWIPDPFGKVEELTGQIDPTSIDADSHVVIEESTPERLRLRTRFLGHETARLLAALISLVVSVSFFLLLWLVLEAVGRFVWPQGGQPAWIAWSFEGLEILPALAGQAVGLWLLLARTSLELTPQSIACRWHLGRIGFSKRLRPAVVSRVVVLWQFDASVGGRNSALRSLLHTWARTPLADCLIETADDSLRLSLFDSLQDARTAAGVIRWQLHKWGLLQSARPAAESGSFIEREKPSDSFPADGSREPGNPRPIPMGRG